MAKSRDVLLKLVRIAMGWENDYTLPGEVNWEEVLDIAVEQGVDAIILDGYEILLRNNPSIKDGLSSPENKILLLQAIGQVPFIESSYKQHINVLKELAEVLNSKGIPFLLMKGLSCGRNYPNPSHRSCGDIDIYPGDFYNESNEALKKAGIEVDPNYYRHSVSYIKDVMIENHRVLCDLRGPTRQTREFEKLLEKMAKQSITNGRDVVINGSKITGVKEPSANFNALFMPWHVSAHVAFERVTVRHLLDWALFLMNEGKEIDVEMFREAKRKYTYGYSKIADVLTALALKYLHMPAGDVPNLIIEDAVNTNKQLVDKVLEYMFEGQLRERDERVWKFRINNVKKVWRERWKYEELFGMNVLLFLYYKVKGVVLHEGE